MRSKIYELIQETIHGTSYTDLIGQLTGEKEKHMGTWGFVYPILGFEEMVETQSDNYSSKSVGNQHTGKWFHQSVCHEKV